MKNILIGYQTGVNLGGWISQYAEATKEHFESFITEEDIKKIASWGMDHVRLPIDYMVIEDEENPLHYKEEGFTYIDQCIKWCEENNLNIILDLHRTAGYAFHQLGENVLFEDDSMQNRFLSIWQEFANRYKKFGRNVTFELLNEIVEPDTKRWNNLSRRAIQAIREIDKNRAIIIGGNQYNSVTALNELNRIADENLIYTFHFYEPHIFTHQMASWEPIMKEINLKLPYPSGAEDYRRYLVKPENLQKQAVFEERMNKETLRKYLQPALDFIKERNVPLYCGEYGVIENADIESTVHWHDDLSSLLIEYGIGRAVWTYKAMDFSMIQDNSQVRDERLIQAVSRRS